MPTPMATHAISARVACSDSYHHGIGDHDHDGDHNNHHPQQSVGSATNSSLSAAAPVQE